MRVPHHFIGVSKTFSLQQKQIWGVFLFLTEPSRDLPKKVCRTDRATSSRYFKVKVLVNKYWFSHLRAVARCRQCLKEINDGFKAFYKSISKFKIHFNWLKQKYLAQKVVFCILFFVFFSPSTVIFKKLNMRRSTPEYTLSKS